MGSQVEIADNILSQIQELEDENKAFIVYEVLSQLDDELVTKIFSMVIEDERQKFPRKGLSNKGKLATIALSLLIK